MMGALQICSGGGTASVRERGQGMGQPHHQSKKAVWLQLRDIDFFIIIILLFFPKGEKLEMLAKG